MAFSRLLRDLDRWMRMPFLSCRGSRPGLFNDLSAGESCPLRILPRSLLARELRFPPLISPEKDEGLPPGILEKASAPMSISNAESAEC